MIRAPLPYTEGGGGSGLDRKSAEENAYRFDGAEISVRRVFDGARSRGALIRELIAERARQPEPRTSPESGEDG